MTEYLIIIIEVAAAIAAGVLAGYGAVYAFNKMPASWLCDYGQEPSEELRDPYTQRIKGYPWKLIFSGFFTAGAINVVLFNWQLAVAALVFCWALVIIAIADHKYGIIPDQFVILTAISAMGFIPFYDSFMDQVLGLAAGGGIMLVAAFIGKLIFKRESLGFGDVKLFSAIGLALGLHGTFIVLVMSSLLSALIFSILLIRRKIKMTDSMPLGPYICGSAIFYVAIILPLL